MCQELSIQPWMDSTLIFNHMAKKNCFKTTGAVFLT